MFNPTTFVKLAPSIVRCNEEVVVNLPAAIVAAVGLKAPAAKSFRLVVPVPWLAAAESPATTEKATDVAVVAAALAVKV